MTRLESGTIKSGTISSESGTTIGDGCDNLAVKGENTNVGHGESGTIKWHAKGESGTINNKPKTYDTESQDIAVLHIVSEHPGSLAGTDPVPPPDDSALPPEGYNTLSASSRPTQILLLPPARATTALCKVRW